jgi:hypothetical protein
MAELVDMASTPAEIKEEKAEVASAPDVPRYPWGLQIRLEKPDLDKLGVDKLPAVGDEFHIMSVGRVTSVSQEYRDSTDESKCVSIQLVMMRVMNEGQEPDDSPAEENKEQAKRPSSVLSYYGGK